MFDLFSSLSVRNKEVANSYLQTLLKIQERELFTGVLHVQNGEKSQAVMFFREGVLFAFYTLVGRQWLSVSRQDWNHELTQTEGNVRVLALPVERLRIFLLFLEHERNEEHTFISINADKIPDWEQSDSPSLVHVRQGETQAFFVFLGGPSLPLESLLIGSERFQSGSAVLTQIKSWGNRACYVTRLPTNLESVGGNEYVLRVAFSSLAQRTLERYQELAGRFLVTHLNDAINYLNEQNRQSMYFLGTNVNHREFFMDSEQAGRVYKILLEKMYEEMSLVVGSEIAGRIFEDALASTSPRLRRQLETYVLARIPFPIKLEVKP